MNILGRLTLSSALIITALNCFADKANEITFKDPHIHYMGRVTMKNDAAELSWSASSVVVNFNGTEAKAELMDETGHDLITIIADDKIVTTLQPSTTRKVYTLVNGLPAGPHKLELFKRTEYEIGRLWFYSITLNNNGKFLPPPVYEHKIEYYGDSITNGYAVEDTTGKDRGAYEFENSFKSYATLTARSFKADYNVIAKSGIGITVSWFPYTMPDVYDLTYAKDPATKWDFKRFTPDVVVINLFQNDSWIVKQHENANFKANFGNTLPTPGYIIDAYQKFVTNIRDKYPKARIICVLGNMDITREGSEWPGYVERAIAGLNDKNIFTHFFPYKGTSGHPSATEQQAMANDLTGFIGKLMNW